MNQTYKLSTETRALLILSIVLIISIGLLDLYSVVLFHTVAEAISIFIALMAAVIIGLTYKTIRNQYLLFLGLGYFWIALLDSLHTLTFEGFQVFSLTGVPVSVQLWIVARLIESLVLLFGVLTLYSKRVATRPLSFFLFTGSIATLGLALIMNQQFPAVYIPDSGLTSFKIFSEYLIITLLCLVMILQFRKRKAMDRNVFLLLTAAIATTIVAELVFTFYKSPSDLAVIIGHQLKVLSFLLIFMAIVRVLLLEPLRALGSSSQSFDILPDVVMVLDSMGIIRQANLAAYELANDRASIKDLVGFSMHDIFHSRYSMLEECPVCRHLTSPSDKPIEYIDSESHKTFNIRLKPVSDSFTNKGTVLIARDISNIKKQQNRIQELYNELSSVTASIRDIMCRLDLHGRVSWCNHAFGEYLGKPDKNIIAINFLSFIHPDDKNKYDMMIDQVRIDGQADSILRFRTSQGDLQFHFSIAPVYNERGSVGGFTLLGRDVTQQQEIENYARTSREKLESEVKTRTRELEEINKELESFSYSVSHDLRAPVRRISGFVQLLGRTLDSLDDSTQEYINRIEKSANDMNELIDGLLQLSRYTRHNMKITNVDVTRTAEDVIEELQKETSPRQVDVYIEKGLRIQADALLLRIVLTNLLSNAWKYTEKVQKPEIKLERVHLERTDGLPCFCVSDNGIGFDNKFSEQIFSAFQRLNKKEEYEGTGIGLATVKRAISRHGGEVWAESSEGEGARFYFTINQAFEA